MQPGISDIENKYVYLPITSWFVNEELLLINSKPVTLFKTALIHRAHSSCRNASENFARLRSLSFSRTSNSDVSPPSSRNSISHFLEHPSSFRIKLVYVFSEGTRTSLINNSGSILFKLRRPVLSLQLISSLLAFASFFQYEDILESFPEDTRLACYFCLVFSFLYDLKGHISVYTLYVRGAGGGAHPGGFDIFAYFYVKCFTQGENTDVKYPFPGSKFCLI